MCLSNFKYLGKLKSSVELQLGRYKFKLISQSFKFVIVYVYEINISKMLILECIQFIFSIKIVFFVYVLVYFQNFLQLSVYFQNGCYYRGGENEFYSLLM